MEIVLSLGGLLFAVLSFHIWKEREERRHSDRTQAAETLLAEAEAVILDLLEHGAAVAQVTQGSYRGTLCVRAHRRGREEWYYSISMYDTGDLAGLDKSLLAKWHLEGFVERYGFYYDEQRDSIVYETSTCAKLSEEDKEALDRRLWSRLEKHPLAVLRSDSRIRTRGI